MEEEPGVASQFRFFLLPVAPPCQGPPSPPPQLVPAIQLKEALASASASATSPADSSTATGSLRADHGGRGGHVPMGGGGLLRPGGGGGLGRFPRGGDFDGDLYPSGKGMVACEGFTL
jgi:hypothetical protein